MCFLGVDQLHHLKKESYEPFLNTLLALQKSRSINRTSFFCSLVNSHYHTPPKIRSFDDSETSRIKAGKMLCLSGVHDTNEETVNAIFIVVVLKLVEVESSLLEKNQSSIIYASLQFSSSHCRYYFNSSKKWAWLSTSWVLFCSWERIAGTYCSWTTI